MKNLLIVIILITICNISPAISSEIKYIDSIDNKFIDNKMMSISVFNETVYFMGEDNGFYSVKNGVLNRLFENEINILEKGDQILLLDMEDTSFIVFRYYDKYNGNRIIIKDNSKWLSLDSSNNQFTNHDIYDVISGENKEIAIINISNKIGFVNEGNIKTHDCDMDYECMPLPFNREIGVFFDYCYYYINSKGNMVKMRNKEIEKIIPYKDFFVEKSYHSFFNSFQLYEDKLYFSSPNTHLLYSFKNDTVSSFNPLPEVKNKELRFDPYKMLLIKDFVFGNDGNLYILFSEAYLDGEIPVPSPTGRMRVIKMTTDFDILEILPIPMEISTSPFLINITKDKSDINNKKIYIGASVGYYVYDPEPTSVENNTETGKPALFIQGAYPNPSNNIVNVKYGADAVNSGKVKMFITNIMGEKVREYDSHGSYSSTTGYGNCTIDVSGLPTSNYLLVISDGSNYATRNILVVN